MIETRCLKNVLVFIQTILSFVLSRKIINIKVVLDLSNYATKKKLKHATDADTSDIAAKKDFMALKGEVGKLDINKLTNVPTSLNNLTAKVDDFDVGKLKTVPVDMKNLSDVVDNKVAKTQISTH